MTIRAVHVAGEAGWGDEYVEAERVETTRQVLRRLDAGEVDCVVSGFDLGGDGGVVSETGLDVLRAVRERDGSVPFLLYTDRTDGDVAIEATRHGVTEYVSLERLRHDEMTLADRVRKLADDREPPAVPYDRNAIAELTRIAASDDASFDGKVNELLDLGRDFLDLDIGFVSRIDGESHTITHAQGSADLAEMGPVDLSATYCQYTVQSESLFGIRDAVAEGWDGDPKYEQSGLSCYLGGRITVGDELYGTLCFADEDPRALAFTDDERTFIELLVEWLGHEITREKREASLRRYKAIHETVQQMVFVIGEDTKIELLTEPLAQRFGYDREEMRGKPATAFLDSEAISAGYEALEELQSISGGGSRSIETQLTTADGEVVPVEIELSLLSDETEFRGLVGVIYDRSDLAETEAELEAERNRFRYLFEHIPDPVLITEFEDGNGVVRAVNPAFESVFGYTESEVNGELITDLIVPEGAHEESLDLGAKIKTEGSVVAEVRRNTADGYRRFLFRGFEYQTGGSDLAFSIYTDITERAEREQYLKVVNRILRHNLRNDLSIIMGFADVLADDVDDEMLASRAETIESTARDLSALVEKANEMARIVGQRTTATSHGVDLVDVVEKVRVKADTAHPDAQIVSTVSGECIVRADSELSRILRELVDNAIRHGDPDSPRVEFSLRPGGSGDEYVTLAVRDNGPGIPTADRERVLGEREITQLDHAQGIGLWLVKWIVESYGGDLRFEVDDDGTTVLLEVPKYDSEDDEDATGA